MSSLSSFRLSIVVGFLFCLLVVLLVPKEGIWAYSDQDCIRCHSKGSGASTLHISLNQYRASVHGEILGCQDCHTGVKDKGHERRSRGMAVDCNVCHDQQNHHGFGSDSDSVPQCYSCHTKHYILPSSAPGSTVNPKNLSSTCKACHPAEVGSVGFLSVFATFRLSSHKKENFAQKFAASDCLGCHQGAGAHGEKEPINDRDCYQCHLDKDEENALLGYIHPQAHVHERLVMKAIAIVYFISAVALIIGGVLFFTQKLSTRKNGRKITSV